jgi:hypothetical protein
MVPTGKASEAAAAALPPRPAGAHVLGLAEIVESDIRTVDRHPLASVRKPRAGAQVFVMRRICAHAEDYGAAPIAALGQRQRVIDILIAVMDCQGAAWRLIHTRSP